MTQREKLGRARIMAMQVQSVAATLRQDARDFDCRFPIAQAKRLEEIANEFLKLK